MESISKDTMWFIVEQQRQQFKDNWESELSDWIGRRLEEQDWECLEVISGLDEWDSLENSEVWERVIYELYYMFCEEDRGEDEKKIYYNLEIQHRSDKKWMCEMMIKKVKEAIIHE
jgi:hypothetical protein